MPATMETFALRFALPSPPWADPGAPIRISCIKGTTRMTGTDIARIAAADLGMNPFRFTAPQYTQFGPVADMDDLDGGN